MHDLLLDFIILNNTFCTCFSVYIIFFSHNHCKSISLKCIKNIYNSQPIFQEELSAFFLSKCIELTQEIKYLPLNCRWRILNTSFIIATTCLNKFYKNIKLEGKQRNNASYFRNEQGTSLNCAVKKKP